MGIGKLNEWFAEPETLSIVIILQQPLICTQYAKISCEYQKKLTSMSGRHLSCSHHLGLLIDPKSADHIILILTIKLCHSCVCQANSFLSLPPRPQHPSFTLKVMVANQSPLFLFVFYCCLCWQIWTIPEPSTGALSLPTKTTFAWSCFSCCSLLRNIRILEVNIKLLLGSS